METHYQRVQRIAIPTFIKGSSIWLLDEPTTALDEDNTKTSDAID